MQSAAGLSHWREEITGVGRTKSRRYHYQHAAQRQLELDLLGPTVAQTIDFS